MTNLEQSKRQSAQQDKTTKLRSPLFFVNPTRLSFRNLSREVDEKTLKKTVVKALTEGLGKVNKDDLVNLLKAKGEDPRLAADAPEPFDSKNVKKFLPSLHIDREVLEKDGKKTVGASRGFAFVDFAHHEHALAVLREANFNPRYSGLAAHSKAKGEQVMGSDGKPKKPCLIVEFVVENKVKSEKQRKKREEKEGNRTKQRMEKGKKAKEDKKSRGQKQREKKRKAAQGLGEDNGTDGGSGGAAPVAPDGEDEAPPPPAAKRGKKAVDAKQKKPKRKVKDAEDVEFEKMVEKYKSGFEAKGGEVAEDDGKNKKKKKKGEGGRWFE